METNLTISLLIAVILLVLYFAGDIRVKKLTHLLPLIPGAMMLSQGTNDSGSILVYTVLIALLVFTILSFLNREWKWLSMLFAPAFAGIVVFLANNRVVELSGSETLVSNKFVLLGLFLAAFAFSVSRVKAYFLEKMNLESPDLQQIVEMIFAGFALYLGHFGASIFGVYLVGSVLIVGAVFTQKSIQIGLVVGVLLLVMLQNSVLDVTGADTIFGFLFGLGVGLLATRIGELKTRMGFWASAALLLTLACCIGLGFAGTMHPAMGGTDALLSFIFALAMQNLGNTEVRPAALSATLVFIAFPAVLYFTEKSEEPGIEKTTTSTNAEAKVEEVKTLPLNGDLSGEFTLDSSKSKVDFTLGPKNETKGAFKKANGVISFGESPEQNTCKIELNMEDFTTFNKFRDESLQGDEYFKVEQFPQMTYQASKAIKLDDSTFEFDGKFTMLGKTNPLKVTFQRLDREGEIVLIGKGQIDRTKFGMTPSVTEGNIVSFSYEVYLQK